jgi:uncharacterized protein with PIN domain
MQINPKATAEAFWWIVTITSCISATGGVIWTVWIIRAFRREKRWLREGRCLRCGYDLRESQARCPECGQAILRVK